jgi:hypothetical protein
MAILLESAIVRIWNANKSAVGTGVLVTDSLVLNCAHVIARVLGISDDTPEMPAGEISLDFPLVAPETRVTVRVSQWLPVQPDGSGDLACLELRSPSPPGTQPVPLMAVTELWGHPFRAFGFPAAHDSGVWASGILRSKQADGWIQIEDVKQTGYFVEPGFSGTPVWDETVKGVVGITVTAEKRRDVRAAFAIPTNSIVAGFPGLAHVVRDAPLPEQEEALREVYCPWLIRKAGYVPLADIDPQRAAAEPESRLNLDAIYTALLTLTPEEHDQFRKEHTEPDRRKSALEQLDAHQYLVL